MTATLRHQPPMVAYWGSSGINEFSTHSYRDWHHLPEDTITGIMVDDLAGPEATDDGMPHVEAVLAGHPQTFDRTSVDPSGEVRYSQGTYTPYFIAGVVQGFFSVVVDTTDKVVEAAALLADLEAAVLRQERERVAADLHDKVVQRLYAIGMTLSLAIGQNTSISNDVAENAVDGIDAAIRDLRSSISNLTARRSPVELAAAVAVTARQAADALGFAPTVTYLGLLDLDPVVSQELLATLTEALSNVAKHAQASEVTITITAEQRHIVLTITDNGQGIGQLNRMSGLANMRARAERLGGEFSWGPNPTGGTILHWQAPAHLQPPASP